MQTNLARLAIDQGADVVVGYHPTVIQGGEIYKGRPIAYSLGDFVFRPDEPIENQDSAMLKVDLKDDQMRVELVPVRVRDSHPKTLTGAASQAVLQRIEQASSQFDQPLKSPVVLDLKARELPPDTVSDPSSPFVSPEAADVVPVDLEPKPPLPIEASAEPGGTVKQPLVPEAAAPLPEVSEPGVLPELEIEFDEDLPDWGPKVSPQQREFKPVPPQRSGGDAGMDTRSKSVSEPIAHRPGTQAVAAEARPHLWGEPVAFQVPAVTPRAPAVDGPAADGQDATAWADAVPAIPTPTGLR
jgi:poly-gamma-glutamate synthesis protein (capsule biosynthesis protein)